MLLIRALVHRFFDRPPFPLERYRRAGVPVALGTDSLASNQDLDLRQEARLLLEGRPELSPIEVLGMATEGGARALGLVGEVGCLESGARADALLLPMAPGTRAVEAVESLLQGDGGVSVLLGGPRLAGSPGKACHATLPDVC